MDVHLIDGTYELFRYFYAVPSKKSLSGIEVGALRGVLGNVVSLLENGATHIAVATDHVITSFRNELWDDYKDGSAVDPEILCQFLPLEESLLALGIPVWPMVEFEADDGLAAGALMAQRDLRVDKIFICTVDKDLGQCVGGNIVQWDRRKDVVLDELAIKNKFGVAPRSIPDYLALVGDSADGFPGIQGWGPKSSALVLSQYGTIEQIPANHADWDIAVRGGVKLANVLVCNKKLALLFKKIATVRTDAPVSKTVDELRWEGPKRNFADICESISAPSLFERVTKLVSEKPKGLKWN